MGFSEVRKLGSNDISTTEGHTLLYTGNDNKHIHGVGLVIHHDLTRTSMRFEPINGRITIIIEPTDSYPPIGK